MPEVAPPPAARDLIARLPRTFGTALNGQLRNWDLLFPAEQRRLRFQLDWLDRLPGPEFQRIFIPILDLESKMDLPRWTANSAGFSVQDVGVLARSPLYPQWRAQVEKVFAQIDEALKESGALKPVNRMVFCILPSHLPLPPGPLWPELEKTAVPLLLNKPFGEILPGFAAALAARQPKPGLDPIETTWIFECESLLSGLTATTPASVLSWEALAATRREFLTRLNTISRSIRSVDQTHEELKRMDISRLTGPAIGGNPKVREFVRDLLLSGNGSLVFNNSFVQWGASEAMRRAEPQVLIACFGIRQKLKPFSSSVLFEDQSRRNPTPDAKDPAGSLVDAIELANYVYLAAQSVPAYQSHALTFMAVSDLNRILVLGPKAPLPESVRVTEEELTRFAVSWLSA
jgi:hypothetical protein